MNDLFQEAREMEVIATFAQPSPNPGLPGRRIFQLKSEVSKVLERLAYNIQTGDPCTGPGGDFSPLGAFLLSEIELLTDKLKRL